MSNDQIEKKLDKIQAALDRIEKRQREGLKDIQEAKPPQTGTFGTSELPQEEEKS